jgi:hypothetical protein
LCFFTKIRKHNNSSLIFYEHYEENISSLYRILNLIKTKTYTIMRRNEMYKSILKQYIERLKKEDIIKFIGKNNYQVSDKEIDTIYFYIKNYWEDIFDNQEDIWNKIKQEVSPNTFIQIQGLYQKYKKYIN